MLINSIETIREYVSIGSLNFSEIKPHVREAQNSFLIPHLGKALVDYIDAITESSGTQKDLKDMTIEALAPMVVLSYIPEGEIKIDSSGLTRNEDERQKSAFGYQVGRLNYSLMNRAYNALDRLLLHLEKNADSIAPWKDSEQFTRYNSLLVRNGTTFGLFYKNAQPQVLFSLCFSIMQTVEDLIIIPVIGETFNQLKSKQKTANLSATEKVLVNTLSKSIVYFTLSRAVIELNLKIDGNGVLTVYPGSNDGAASDVRKQSASELAKSNFATHCENIAKELLDHSISYLNANATSEVFTSWFNAMPQKSSEEVETKSFNEQNIPGAYGL